MSTVPNANRPSHLSLVFWLALIAALAYCSWPLSYLLNPQVAAHELASQLEAPAQPYDWVFVGMDVLSGILLVTVGAIQIWRQPHRHMQAAIVAYLIFALGVMGAALVGLPCDPVLKQCGPLIDNPIVLLHGGCSILSIMALFSSLALAARLAYRRSPVSLAFRWCAIALVLWVISGILSLAYMAFHAQSNVTQNYFITVCSFTAVIVVYVVERLRKSYL